MITFETNPLPWNRGYEIGTAAITIELDITGMSTSTGLTCSTSYEYQLVKSTDPPAIDADVFTLITGASVQLQIETKDHGKYSSNEFILQVRFTGTTNWTDSPTLKTIYVYTCNSPTFNSLEGLTNQSYTIGDNALQYQLPAFSILYPWRCIDYLTTEVTSNPSTTAISYDSATLILKVLELTNMDVAGPKSPPYY